MAVDTTTTDEPEPATGADEPANIQLGEAGQKALREERAKAKAEAKRAAALEARLKEFEDRDKTETQRLAEGRQAAEQRATTAEQALVRYQVAVSKGVPAELVDRLRGATPDELAQDADRLLELLGKQPVSVPSFDGGSRMPAPVPQNMSARIRRQAGIA